jgi:hypothetical protein
MRPILTSYICSSRTSMLFSAILSIAQSASAQSDCQLKRQKEDLKVYTCSSSESKLKVLRAEFIIKNTSFDNLLEFLRDINNCVTWQYNTIEAGTLQRRGGAVIYRTVIEGSLAGFKPRNDTGAYVSFRQRETGAHHC